MLKRPGKNYLLYKFFSDSAFVPKHRPIVKSDIDCLVNFMSAHRRILVLTGAGISTECGLPDYRSEIVGLFNKKNYKPTQYQEFVKSAHARKRYWARSYVGWPRLASLKPSPAMITLAKRQPLTPIVTQNVDGLHCKAGTKDILELHGTLHRVVCLKCQDITRRDELQNRLEERNPSMDSFVSEIRPDGDVELSEEQISHFQTVACTKCGGILKPDVVFFGENVPAERVKRVNGMVESSDALLVLGSSLTVYSSYRIALLAHNQKKKLMIVNIGETRADDIADFKIGVKIGDLLMNMPSEAKFMSQGT